VAEPVLEARKNELGSQPEQRQCGNQAQAHKSRHQPGLEFGAEEIAFPFEEKLDDVAQHQIGEQQEQNNVEIDQGKQEDIARQGQVGLELEEPSFQKPKYDHQQEKQNNPEPLFAAAVLEKGEAGEFHARVPFRKDPYRVKVTTCQSVSKSHSDTKKKM